VEDIFIGLLNQAGILIRDVSKYPLLDGHLRISLGTPEENALLLTTLEDLVTQAR